MKVIDKCTIKHCLDTCSYVFFLGYCCTTFCPLPCCTSLRFQAQLWLWARLFFSLSGRLPVTFRPTTSFKIVHPLSNILLQSTHWDKSATSCCIADCSQLPACFFFIWATCGWGHWNFLPGVTWKKNCQQMFCQGQQKRSSGLFQYSKSACYCLSSVDWLLHAGKWLTYILWTLVIIVFNRFMGFWNLSLKIQLQLWFRTELA